RKWSLNRKGLFTAIEDKITKEDTQTNLEVEDRQEEAESMIYDLQNENIGAGYYTFTLILKDKDIKKLEDNLQNVIAKIQNLGFVAVRETLNTLEAFFGSMPGDIEHNVRKPILNTTTFADLMPLSTIWAGESWNKHLNAPPLLYCTSNNSTPFRFGLHQGDVGHTSIFGQTGGGKSVLLCTLASNWLKHENAQVIIFDKGGSSRVLTEAVEGKFYDLGVDRITFQPLANVDIQSEREWAYEWLCDIYTQENIELTGEHKNAIAKALIDISHLEKSQRTLTSYWLSVQDDLLKQGIKQFTNDGNLGRYFDGNKDDFNKNNPWQVFEMDKILASKSAVSPL
ncbi:MAG: helicase HerA domain-containing protein, partial [Sarcina sp.]